MIIAEDAGELDPTRMPRHVACIMDGNGRWARSRGLPRTDGHRAGEEALVTVVDTVLELGIPWLSVYAFSTENWDRPVEEVEFLMSLHETLFGRRKELHEKGVRIRWAGRRPETKESRAPAHVLAEIDEATTMTRDNRRLNFTIAFDYGGRAEIVDAVRSIVRAGIAPDDVDEGVLADHLYEPEMPDVDLLVRTSGELRISNFLLWKVAYSEIVFTDTLWPDFGRLHVISAVREFQQRDRRKGRIDETVPPATA
jgi:undecaprenyl diphosphate synthase